MKKMYLFFTLAAFTCLPLYGGDTNLERILDLEECIRLASLNNESLLLVKKEYEIAQQRILESNAFSYPNLDFDFNYFRYMVTGDTEKKPGLPYSYVFLPDTGLEPQDYFTTRFSLTQNLYSGGRISNAKKLARINLKKVEIQTERKKNEIVYQTRKAFYECLFAKEKMFLYEKNLNFIEQMLVELTKRNVSPEEQRKVSLYRNKLKSNFVNAEYEFKQTKLQLLDVIGLELNTKIDLKGSAEMLPKELNLEKILVWAYQYRPELKQIQLEEEIDTLSVNLALAERHPTLSLGANYLFVGPLFPYPEKNWLITVGISVPLFDGWAGWSRIRQSQINLERNKLKRVEWEDLINMEIRQTYNETFLWQEELETWSKEIREEGEFFEISKVKWSTGEMKTEQLLDELKNLIFGKEKYLETLYKNLLTQAKLEKAMGKSLIEK